MRIPFGVAAYKLRSEQLSVQSMVNCYLEQIQAADTFAANVQAYGTRSWTTVGTGPIRGGAVINGVLYVVSGPSAYRVDQSGTATLLGAVPNANYVYIAGDGTNVVFVNNPNGYIWNGSSFAQITDPDFPGAIWVGFLDGYFPIIEPNSGRIWINETPYVPANWNALDFGTAEASPDDLIGGIVSHRELYAFGRDSIEVYYNQPQGSDFPLARSSNGVIERGCMSQKSIAKDDNSVFFLGDDGIVYRLNGYAPVRISDFAIEQAIEDSDDKDIHGFTFTEGGHKFYALTCTDFTFCYDIATQLWHQRKSYGLEYWRPIFILRAFNKHLVGDSLTPRIGELDPDTFTEWGDVLRSSATAPIISSDNKRMFFPRVELKFESGVGLVSGQGSDPQVMLRWSDDRGKTWSSEHWRSLGEIGDYNHRSIWNRGGQSRGRVYEYAITDPVRRTLIMATAEVEVGVN